MLHRVANVMTGSVFAFILCTAAAEDTIKIGYISGLTGPMALQALEVLKTFQAAADLVNLRGGVLGGKRIEVVAFDNKLSAQETLVVLRKAIDQDVQFVTTGTSIAVHALNDALAKHNARDPKRAVLLLDYNAQDPALTESKCTFWHFRFMPHADTEVAIIADQIARQSDIHKVYLINQDYAFGQAVSRSAREALAARRPDIQIVGDDLHPIGKVKDFSPYVSKIAASGADTVITGNWGSDLILLLKASDALGSKALFYAVNGTIPGTAAGVGGAGAHRLKSIGAWHINAADAAWRKTLLEYKRKYTSTTNMDFLQAYRTIDMLVAAINRSGSTDPIKVAYALEGMKYSGPTGESWMRAEDHQMMAPLFILSLTQAGQPGVEFDEEGSGYGWKTDGLVGAKDTISPMKCQMERPSM